MNRSAPAAPRLKPSDRVLTGRAVLLMLVAFFGIVIIVNVFMARAAISTFGGVDTPSSYQAGLTFKAEEAAAAEQNAREWKVDAKLTAMAGGVTALIAAHDAGGRPVVGAEIVAHLAHPVDERRDRTITLAEIGSGNYRGQTPAEPGQWVLDIEISRAGKLLFRSRNRVTIP